MDDEDSSNEENFEERDSESKKDKNENKKNHKMSYLEYIMKNSIDITHLGERNLPIDKNSKIKIEKNCINFTILSTKNNNQNTQNEDKVYCG